MNFKSLWFYFDLGVFESWWLSYRDEPDLDPPRRRIEN